MFRLLDSARGGHLDPTILFQQPDEPLFNYNGAERAPVTRAGINVQAIAIVRSEIDRGVPVHDQCAVVARVVQEFSSDPKKVRLGLRIKWHAGSYPCVDENDTRFRPADREPLQERHVTFGHSFARRCMNIEQQSITAIFDSI